MNLNRVDPGHSVTVQGVKDFSEERLLTAAGEGDQDFIEEALRCRKISKVFLGSLLHKAAEKNEYKMVKLLLGRGADPNVTNLKGDTLLHEAAFLGQLELAELLLSKGANPNITNSGGDTPLYCAALVNKLELVELLLSKGANPNVKNLKGNTPLHDAAFLGKLELAELLLSKGADPNITNLGGDTPLHRTAFFSKIELAKLLLKEGADPNATNLEGNTPLCRAALLNKFELAELLISKGANPNVRNLKGNTLLHETVLLGKLELAEFLLSNGADPNATNSEGNTPLHRAAFLGRFELVELLLRKGADPNAKNSEGNTPLHRAALLGKLELAKLLLRNGADPDAKNSEGNTPLHHAALLGKFELAELLLKNGADRNRKNYSGETPTVFANIKSKNEQNSKLMDLFPLTKYDNQFRATKIISHVFSCAGKIQDVSLNGACPMLMRQFLGEALESFKGEGITEEIKAAFKNSYERSNENIKESENLVEKIRQGELVFISSGWKRHAVDLVFFNGYMAISNRGENFEEKSTLEVFKIDPTKMTPEVLRDLDKLVGKSFSEAASYVYEGLPKHLNGGKLVQDELCRAFKVIAPKRQKSGNCAFASPEGALRFAIGMSMIKKEQSSWIDSIEERQKKLLEKAKSLHKIFNSHVSIYAFNKYQKQVLEGFPKMNWNKRVEYKCKKDIETLKSNGLTAWLRERLIFSA